MLLTKVHPKTTKRKPVDEAGKEVVKVEPLPSSVRDRMNIVSTTDRLASLCSTLAQDSFIAVDTEFMREQTYWPELCLIQIAGAEREAIIDPLVDGLNLDPFFELMANERVVKVFHAARQDIEIFVNRSGAVPKPIFDTQLAAMVCGFGDQVGYEAIVRKLAKAHIDKSSRFTDWSRRPLSEKQLAYALSDVTHLRPVYQHLKAELDKTGREPWLDQELAVLTSPETYRTDPQDAWKRVKTRVKSKKQLAVLMALAAWREREARDKNVPRARILKDDALVEIANQAPQSREALSNLRALPKGFANSRHGEAILAAVNAALASDHKSLHLKDSGRDDLNDNALAAAEILKLALKIVCERRGIAPRIVANSSDIEAIAQDDNADVPLMHGWRRELFGNLALDIKAGRAVIGFKKGRTEIIAAAPDVQIAAE
jgi:ribonuclease D